MDERLLKKVANLPVGSKQVIKTWHRSAVVTPQMVGYTFGIHNGRVHVSIVIVENMVGHKLGEFAATRKFIRHSGDKK